MLVFGDAERKDGRQQAPFSSSVLRLEVKVAQSCPTLCSAVDYTVHGIFQARRVGSLCLLQGIFLTQESNLGLLLPRWILDQLSYQGFLKTEGKCFQFLCQENYINRCPGRRDLDCRMRESPFRTGAPGALTLHTKLQGEAGRKL